MTREDAKGSPVRPIPLERLRFVGRDLVRPECVVCTSDGSVHVSDWRGGVTSLEPAGGQSTLLAAEPGFALRPNGIAAAPDGGFFIAHLGADTGGAFHLDRQGRLRPVLIEIDGEALPPTNFVHRDARGRLWITISTRMRPRDRAYRSDVADGFIVLVDGTGARIVADGLGYTNECLLDPAGDRLLVNETFARRLTSFAVTPDGDLTDRRTEAVFGPGMFPDGLARDADGGLWVISVVSNTVLRIAPDGERTTVIADPDPDHVAWVEQAYRRGTVGRPHLDRIGDCRLSNISSIAFGGRDRRTAYLGCLLGDALACFDSPVAGAGFPQWRGLDRPAIDRPADVPSAFVPATSAPVFSARRRNTGR